MTFGFWHRPWRRVYCSVRFSSGASGGRLSGVCRPERPALWFFGSMLLRTSVTLAGFYFVGREDWQRWLLCLLGFVLARLLVEVADPPAGRTSQPPGIGHRLCALVPMR